MPRLLPSLIWWWRCCWAAVRRGGSTKSKLRHCPATGIDRAICGNQVRRLRAAKSWTIALSGLKTRKYHHPSFSTAWIFPLIPGTPRESRPMARWRPRFQVVATPSRAANTASLLL